MRTFVRFLFVFVLALGCGHRPAPHAETQPKVASPEPTAMHPLDPLRADEIQLAMRLLRSSLALSANAYVPLLVLEEPGKDVVRSFDAAAPHAAGAPPRRAFAVCLERDQNRTYEAQIDLRQARVTSVREVPGVQPNVLADEFTAMQDVVRNDPNYREALRRRGITNPDDVLIDIWAPGIVPNANGVAKGTRLLRALSFVHAGADNAYGSPIEGLVALVDANRSRVVQIVDRGVLPLPPRSQDFDPQAIGPQRTAPRPLRVVQPEGPSFVVTGREVRWQKWRFRFAMHPREGLVLHTVGYVDGPAEAPPRAILHRASVAEMVVPYGDPSETWAWRSAFDEGEYGLGRLANALEPGLDAPDNATLVDAVMADERGAPYTLPRAVMLYERDAGLLWKHHNDTRGRTDARRARELVVGSMVTVGNYDYAMHWIFSQDGTMRFELLLTGILLAQGSPETRCTACAQAAQGVTEEGGYDTYGTVIAKQLVAPNHQHFVNLRLDFDIEGERNRVFEMNTRSLETDAHNPHGNAFVVERTLLQSEQGAQRDLDVTRHRSWKVVNASERNALGHFAGYQIMPEHNTVPFMAEGSPGRVRAGFVDHHLWVTQYRAHEQASAGPYPNQSTEAEGLPQWTANDEPLVDTDVVVWYTLGVTHHPRAEEWPVMPAQRVGVSFVPAGFFTRNPALDVPPQVVAPSAP